MIRSIVGKMTAPRFFITFLPTRFHCWNLLKGSVKPKFNKNSLLEFFKNLIYNFCELQDARFEQAVKLNP